MKTCLNLCALLLGITFIIGCATQKSAEPSGSTSMVKPDEPAQASLEVLNVKNEPNPLIAKHIATNQYKSAMRKHGAKNEHDPAMGKQIVKKAKTAIGTPYVYGGTAPGGFDCSGLVKWTYNSIGVNLPRTAREQSTVGQKIQKIEDMREGDIVAFNHPQRGYHTGIYVGDGKFIHSPRRRTRVRINSLDEPYFSKTLLGARRISPGTTNVVAQAESRLEEVISQKSKLTLFSKRMQTADSASANKNLSTRSKNASLQKKNASLKNNASKKAVKEEKGKKATLAKNKSSKVEKGKAASSKTEKIMAKNKAKATKDIAGNAKKSKQTNKAKGTKEIAGNAKNAKQANKAKGTKEIAGNAKKAKQAKNSKSAPVKEVASKKATTAKNQPVAKTNIQKKQSSHEVSMLTKKAKAKNNNRS